MSESVTQTPRLDPAALTEPARRVERLLADHLQQRPLPAGLRQAIEYAVFSGGKRLRPVLTLRACEAVGGQADQAATPAAAVELIHGFSLIHDDLPAMDDDDLRRGRPTLHKHAGEAMAILAGDAMPALAHELLATRVTEPALAGKLTGELACATTGMIAGQVYDTLARKPEPGMSDLQRLQRIHHHKTGALLRAACRMGGLAGGGEAAQLEGLTRYAETVGLMFQIVDDLLDATQTTDHLGKTAGKDDQQGKLTYPGLLGVERSRAEVDRLHEQAHDALRDLGRPAAPLRDLADYMAVREK